MRAPKSNTLAIIAVSVIFLFTLAYFARSQGSRDELMNHMPPNPFEADAGPLKEQDITELEKQWRAEAKKQAEANADEYRKKVKAAVGKMVPSVNEKNDLKKQQSDLNISEGERLHSTGKDVEQEDSIKKTPKSAGNVEEKKEAQEKDTKKDTEKKNGSISQHEQNAGQDGNPMDHKDKPQETSQDRLKALFKAAFKLFNFKNWLDYPCGDLGWQNQVADFSALSYTGADSNADVIKKHATAHFNEPNMKFVNLDLSKDNIPVDSFELVTLTDLASLSEKQVESVFKSIESSGVKYVLAAFANPLEKQFKNNPVKLLKQPLLYVGNGKGKFWGLWDLHMTSPLADDAVFLETGSIISTNALVQEKLNAVMPENGANKDVSYDPFASVQESSDEIERWVNEQVDQHDAMLKLKKKTGEEKTAKSDKSEEKLGSKKEDSKSTDKQAPSEKSTDKSEKKEEKPTEKTEKKEEKATEKTDKKEEKSTQSDNEKSTNEKSNPSKSSELKTGDF